MFLIALDKYFLNTLSASYAIDETDKTTFVSPILPLFGQTFDLTSKNVLDRVVNTHSYNLSNVRLPSVLSSNQIRILNTPGDTLVNKLFETLYPLTGTIQKIYVINAALSASFTNVRFVPYSLQNRVSVELSQDGQAWTTQGITFSSWQPHEIKELYIRVKLNNAQVSYDAIGIAITYQAATGKIEYGYSLNSFPSINIGFSSYSFSMFYALSLGDKNIVITGTSFAVHNLGNDNVSFYSGVGSSSTNYFNLSPQRNYLFFSNKIYRTNDMTSIINLSDVSANGWAAGFTPDERYFVYSSTSGLKVIEIPSGQVVKVHNSINLHSLNRSAALYPISPNEIWLFTSQEYKKFEADRPFDSSFLVPGANFLVQYWLDNNTFAIIEKSTYSGLLVKTDNMQVTPFRYLVVAPETNYDINLNLVNSNTLIALHSSKTYPDTYGYSHFGAGRLLTPSTGTLNEWSFYPMTQSTTSYSTTIINGYIYGLTSSYYGYLHYKRFF